MAVCTVAVRIDVLDADDVLAGAIGATSLRTKQLKRSWQWPLSSAARSVVTAAELFELFGQPKPLQKPQLTQGGRCNAGDAAGTAAS